MKEDQYLYDDDEDQYLYGEEKKKKDEDENVTVAMVTSSLIAMQDSWDEGRSFRWTCAKFTNQMSGPVPTMTTTTTTTKSWQGRQASGESKNFEDVMAINSCSPARFN